MSARKDLKAFVRVAAGGAVVPGSLIFRKHQPREGRWVEIKTNVCCGTDPAYLLTVLFDNQTAEDLTIQDAFGNAKVIAAGELLIAQVRKTIEVTPGPLELDADYDAEDASNASIQTGLISGVTTIDLTAEATDAVRITFTTPD